MIRVNSVTASPNDDDSVTVHFGGWDHHWDLKAGMEGHLPIVDAAVSSLFQDLDKRGLLPRTLVVLCGESLHGVPKSTKGICNAAGNPEAHRNS